MGSKMTYVVNKFKNVCKKSNFYFRKRFTKRYLVGRTACWVTPRISGSPGREEREERERERERERDPRFFLSHAGGITIKCADAEKKMVFLFILQKNWATWTRTRSLANHGQPKYQNLFNQI